MADFYFAQSASGLGDGSSPENAFAVSWLNSSSNWANPKVAGKLGPGDTAWICGTITSIITAQNSGSAGNPITIKGVERATAIISGNGANVTGIDLTGRSYITLKSLSFFGQTGANSRAILTANGTNEVIIDDFDIDGNGTAQYGILNSGATVGNVTITNGTIRKVINGSTNGKALSFNSVTSGSIFTVQNVTVGGNLTDACNVGFFVNSVVSAIFHVTNLKISHSLTPGGYAGFHIAGSTLGNGSYFDDVDISYSQANSNLQWNGGGNATFNCLQSSYAASSDNTLGTGVQIYSTAAATSNIVFNGGRFHHNQNDGGGVYQATNALHDIVFNGVESDHNGVLSDANRGDGLTAHGNAYNIYVLNCLLHDNYLSGVGFVETTAGYVINTTSKNNGVSGTRAGIFLNSSGVNTVTNKGWTIIGTISDSDLPYAAYLSTGASTITTFYGNTYNLNPSATAFARINTTDTSWTTWKATYDAIGSQLLNPNLRGDNSVPKSSPCARGNQQICGAPVIGNSGGSVSAFGFRRR